MFIMPISVCLMSSLKFFYFSWVLCTQAALQCASTQQQPSNQELAVSQWCCALSIHHTNISRGHTKMESTYRYPWIVQPYQPQKEQGIWGLPRSWRTFPRSCNEAEIVSVHHVCSVGSGKCSPQEIQREIAAGINPTNSFLGVSLLCYHITISTVFLVCFFIQGTSCISCEFLWLSVIVRSNFRHAAGGKITVGTMTWSELSCCKAK